MHDSGLRHRGGGGGVRKAGEVLWRIGGGLGWLDMLLGREVQRELGEWGGVGWCSRGWRGSKGWYREGKERCWWRGRRRRVGIIGNSGDGLRGWYLRADGGGGRFRVETEDAGGVKGEDSYAGLVRWTVFMGLEMKLEVRWCLMLGDVPHELLYAFSLVLLPN